MRKDGLGYGMMVASFTKVGMGSLIHGELPGSGQWAVGSKDLKCLHQLVYDKVFLVSFLNYWIIGLLDHLETLCLIYHDRPGDTQTS